MAVKSRKKGPSFAQIERRRVEKAKEFSALRRTIAKRGEEGKKGEELATAEERNRVKTLGDELRKLRSLSDDAKLREELDEEHEVLREYRTGRVRRGRTAYGTTGEDDEQRRRSPREVVLLDERRNALAFEAWGRQQLGVELSKRHVQACRSLRFDPNCRNLKLRTLSTEQLAALKRGREPQPETRAGLNVGTNSEGGFLRPTEFLYELEKHMLYYGPMLQAARILRTDNGNSLPMPEVTDTGNTGVLLAEATTIGTSVDPTFSAPTLGAYKMSSKLVAVSAELLEDSAFDLASELAEMLGERLGRVINTYATTGTGSSQPQGVVTGSTLGKTAASTTALAMDEFINLQMSVDNAYRAGAAWMMHDNVLEALQLLKDGDSRYLWEPSLKEGQPDRFRGSLFWVNNDMASSIAAAAKVALYGQFQKMVIRMVRQIRMRRLVERYADTDQEGFVAFARVDSKLRAASAGVIKHMIMAAS